jgi:hypothetical protein
MPKRPFAKDQLNENSGSPKPEKSHDSYVFPEDAPMIPYEEALEEILEEEGMLNRINFYHTSGVDLNFRID